jgi:hypothetical protein
MNRSSRRTGGFLGRGPRWSNAGLVVVCLALAAAVLAVPAGAASVHFVKESMQAYEGQLHKGEVHAVTFHPGTPTGHLHISLDNGGHMSVAYASAEQAKLEAAARAANTRVKVGKASVKTKATPVKHKLRYIVGGVLIVVIIVVLVVLLIGRRRAVAGEGPARSGESGAS